MKKGLLPRGLASLLIMFLHVCVVGLVVLCCNYPLGAMA